MRKISFLLGIVLAVMSCTSTSQTAVTVHIDGARVESQVKLVTGDSVYSAAMDSTGSVHIVLPGNYRSGYATVGFGRMTLPVYIENAGSLDIALTFQGRQLVPVFTGKSAAINEYLNGESFKTLKIDFLQDEAAFIAGLGEKEKELVKVLESRNFDASFVELEKKRVHYMIYSYLTLYPTYHAYYADKPDYRPSDRFFEALKEAVVEDDALVGMAEYKQAWEGMVESFGSKGMVDYQADVYTRNRLDFVLENVKSAAAVEEHVHRILLSHIKGNGVDNIAEFDKIYRGKVVSAKKKAEYEALCTQWGRIAKGQPSPGFKFLDIDDKEVSLEDLAGRYVYIDIWATWCGPCRGELPHMKKLEKQFRGRNIAFVSISCDQDKKAWKKTVKEEQLEGYQLHMGNDRTFSKAYMVKGIPRFILLDKEGRILSAEMTRPSNSRTLETLNSLKGI